MSKYREVTIIKYRPNCCQDDEDPYLCDTAREAENWEAIQSLQDEIIANPPQTFTVNASDLCGWVLRNTHILKKFLQDYEDE